jgi:DNA-binding winged helix-turn-helix (wHTH) protein/Tol biopolymer transport system component
MERSLPKRVRFGAFELDLKAGEVCNGPGKILLQEQPFQILVMLVEHHGQVVTRDEIIKKLWPNDTVVEFDHSIHTAVKKLRQALGDSAESPTYVETVARRGYRLLPPVEWIEPSPVAEGVLHRSDTGGSQLWRFAVAGVIALLVIAGIGFRSLSLPSPAKSELKQRQLTMNSSENTVTGGSISPDGQYLAYADLQGIHIKQIETGETRTVPQPEESKGRQVNWGIATNWVADGSRFIANANVPGKPSSIWVVPIAGEPRKLRSDGAYAWAVSRGNPWVAFTANPAKVLYREMWQMKPDGEQATKLYEGDEERGFYGADWSPDGQRLSYIGAHQVANKVEDRVESRHLKGGPAVVAVPTDVDDWTWLPDGRILYIHEEEGGNGSCNFWTRPLDLRTGSPLGPAKRLTNWAGFCMQDPTASANGKRLAFRKMSSQGSVYVADLSENGRNITTPKRLTLNEGEAYPVAWTADSKAVVLRSWRDGRWGIFKQSLDQDFAERIASGADVGVASGTVSPEGDWVLYLAASDAADHSVTTDLLMRVPVAGGTPQPVLTASLYGKPACARAPASLCAFAEYTPDHKQLVFTVFDPLKGRGGELTRFDTDPISKAKYVWDLSPDGTRIAILEYSTGEIRILPLAHPGSREIVVKNWNNLLSLNWSADGHSIFASSQTRNGSVLLRLDLKGNARVLWEQRGSIAPWNRPFGEPDKISAPWAVPSPDGRHLAIYDWKLNANMWMIENF